MVSSVARDGNGIWCDGGNGIWSDGGIGSGVVGDRIWCGGDGI